MELIPLKRSAEYDDLESEFKALFLSLYRQYVSDDLSELMLYGMPHLSSDEVISMHLGRDGLAMLRDTTNERIRYLFHAWRYNNPQRGTAFLDTYLRTLFGPTFQINQLWCPVDGVYPHDAVSEAEVIALGESTDDYFLTSRLQVDIDTEIVPLRIAEAAKTAVSAKFVLDVRLAKTISLVYKVAMLGWGIQVVRAAGKALYHQREIIASVTVGGGMYAVGSGDAIKLVHTGGSQVVRAPEVRSTVRTGPASRPGAATMIFSSIPRVDMQTYPK
jgi:hypothetical protein